jgi:predicted transcriptional regulator YdeE
LGPFEVVGIQARTSNALESSPATARIPALWQRFRDERVAERIPHRLKRTLAVYHDYESDHAGQYTLTVGCDVSEVGELPAGLAAVSVSGNKCLVFAFRGPLPETVVEGWQRVWQYFADHPEVPRGYSADFEAYGADGVEIHVGLW